MGYGLWAIGTDHCLRATIHGPWSTAHGPRTMAQRSLPTGHGTGLMVREPWVQGSWSTGHGPGIMVHGLWCRDHGSCTMGFSWSTGNCLQSIVREALDQGSWSADHRPGIIAHGSWSKHHVPRTMIRGSGSARLGQFPRHHFFDFPFQKV